jgi:pheromone shutdown protein TraB
MENSTDIYRICDENGRETWLIGTAHISQKSKDLVVQTIENESPDTICVELDEGRLQSLDDPNRWKHMDLKAIIKQHQLATLIVNLVAWVLPETHGDSDGCKTGSRIAWGGSNGPCQKYSLVLADRDNKNYAQTGLVLYSLVSENVSSRRAF